MERALSAAGIEATVLSTADQIQGAPPLNHIQHLVFKVHGDYLDTRIRNTEAEPLLDQALGDTEARGDGRDRDAGLGEIGERDHLVGGMHRCG